MPKSKILKAIIAVIVLVAGLVGTWTALNFVGAGAKSGQPAISRAKDITGIEYPVDDNGDIDFLQLSNAKQMISIKSGNNAVVPIVQNCDPQILEKCPDQFFYLLSISRPTTEGQKFESAIEWIDKVLDKESNSESSPSAKQFVQYASNYAWSEDELPEVARWLDAMAEPIKAFAEAAKRENFYVPVVATDDGKARYFSLRTEIIPYFKEVSSVFQILANRCLASDDFDEWLENVYAIYRLGSLVTKGNSILNQQTAITLHRTADELVASAAINGKLNEAQLREVLKKLGEITPINALTKSIRDGEKLLALDYVTQCARSGKSTFLSGGQTAGWQESLILNAADYNDVLEKVNTDFERIAEITELPLHEMRQAIHDHSKEFEDRDSASGSSMAKTKALLGGRKAKGAYVGERFSLILQPAMASIAANRIGHLATRRLAKLTVALELYKAKHGKYPDSLEELVPDFIASEEFDPFTDKPFTYQPTDERYVLYSWGSNGKDDLGRAGGNADASVDISVKATIYQPWQEFLESGSAQPEVD